MEKFFHFDRDDKIEKNLFNTAIADFMKFSNSNDLSQLSKNEWKKFLIVLSPFAPHLCEPDAVWRRHPCRDRRADDGGYESQGYMHGGCDRDGYYENCREAALCRG